MSPRPTIYLVPMPIGTDWADLTEGARAVLSGCPNLFVEDAPQRVEQMRARGLIPDSARVTVMGGRERAQVGACLDRGESVALVAATGMPCFFDPGWAVLDDWLDHRMDRVDVQPIGMSSALDAALAMSGLDHRSFRFCGHFPENYRTPIRLHPSQTALVYYVRGGAMRAFVRHVQRRVPWLGRLLLIADLRKGDRTRAWVIRGNRGALPDDLRDDPGVDAVAVVHRVHPVAAAVRALRRALV